MAVDFRGHPLFPDGFNSPTRFEAEVYDCEVEGKLPSDLHGTFYRLQCDFAYPPPKNEWGSGFNGDGHVSMFRFANGSVDYVGKYVKTDRLIAERKARKRLFGVYRNRSTDDPSVQNIDRGAANTHIYWHGGKLMTLKEDSLPYLIDPHTLETKGRYDFDGKYKAVSMSAHPKIDPITGEMIAYGYQAKGDLSDDIACYFIDKSGKVTREVWFRAPYVGMIHDIAITQKYILFPVVAMVTSKERLASGEPMWEFKSDYPTMVGVLPRDGDAKDVRWFKGPSRNTLHFLNAVDVGNKIHMDLPVSDTQGSPSRFKRWVFDMKSKKADTFSEEVIATPNGPLIRMDDRFCSLPYKYAFAGNSDPTRPFDEARVPNMRRRPNNTWHRIDVTTGKTSVYYVGPVQGLQEACFAPRSAKAVEGDGYVIGVASNYAEMCSELVVVDAQRMEEGAIATVKLPFRLRSGTHGAWMPFTDLPFA
jgi:carotenoid cleavage dioxygenase-like enzyme